MLQLIPLANRFIPRVGISTVLFGTILYLMMGNLDPQNLWGTTWGRAMLAALTLSLGLLVYGIGYVRRAAERMLKHLNEENCTHGPEVAALQMTSSRGQVVALAWDSSSSSSWWSRPAACNCASAQRKKEKANRSIHRRGRYRLENPNPRRESARHSRNCRSRKLLGG